MNKQGIYEVSVMNDKETVFEKTYRNYISQVNKLNFDSISSTLGVTAESETIVIPLLNEIYRISDNEITDSSGSVPTLDICVILCRYILMCPSTLPEGGEWVSYRDFKDSGPLTVYFANDVERAIAACFKGNPVGLGKSGRFLAAYSPQLDATYDLAMQFDALPRISMVLLFNDADAEFPATCSVLFERRGEQYLDAECLAILGRQLFDRLSQAAKKV